MYWLNEDTFKDIIVKYGHHIYISLNLCIAYFLYAFHSLFPDNIKLEKSEGYKRIRFYHVISKKSVILILSYIIFAYFIFLLESRTGILVFFMMTCVLLYQLGRNKILKWNVILLAISILTFVFVIGIYKNERFDKLLNEDIEVNQKDPRIIIWKSALQLIIEKPFLGSGLGGYYEQMVDKLKENGLNNPEEIQYNSHNQFLEILLENGIVGFILLSLSIAFIIHSTKMKIIKGAFLIVGAICMFECILNRLWGILDLSLLIYLAIVYKDQEINNKKDININYIESKLSIPILLISYLMLLFIPLIINWSKNLVFNPKYPQSYSPMNYNIEVIKNRKLPQIVPNELQKSDANGLKISGETVADTWGNNAYRYINIINEEVIIGDTILSSVFSYVSEDFNGDWVRISAENDVIGNNSCLYDLSKKGTWQKLDLPIVCSTGKISGFLYISKYNTTSFEDLEGYVVFAYPQINVIRNIE
jgi:hypothetical protein